VEEEIRSRSTICGAEACGCMWLETYVYVCARVCMYVDCGMYAARFYLF
jgi:hypothetical protein